MNGPPIPSFEPYSCPNCGLPLRELVEFCPACGAHTDNAKRKPQWLSCLMTGCLVLLMMPFGLSGACFLIIGATGGAGSLFGSSGFSWEALVFGASGFALIFAAVQCAMAIRKLNR